MAKFSFSLAAIAQELQAGNILHVPPMKNFNSMCCSGSDVQFGQDVYLPIKHTTNEDRIVAQPIVNDSSDDDDLSLSDLADAFEAEMKLKPTSNLPKSVASSNVDIVSSLDIPEKMESDDGYGSMESEVSIDPTELIDNNAARETATSELQFTKFLNTISVERGQQSDLASTLCTHRVCRRPVNRINPATKLSAHKVIVFDFSTQSPDDIVTSMQKKAFKK